MEHLSPELVLVDPELRARVAHLPTGPVFERRPDPPPEELAPRSRPLLGRVAVTAGVILVFLALPLLAIAADLVRTPPRLAPVSPSGSRRVDVRAQQQIRPDLPRLQVR